MFNIVALRQVHSPRAVTLSEKREDHKVCASAELNAKKGLFVVCSFCPAIQIIPGANLQIPLAIHEAGALRGSSLSFTPLSFLLRLSHFWARLAAERLPACPCTSSCPAAAPLRISLGKCFPVSSGCRTVPSLRTDQRRDERCRSLVLRAVRPQPPASRSAAGAEPSTGDRGAAAGMPPPSPGAARRLPPAALSLHSARSGTRAPRGAHARPPSGSGAGKGGAGGVAPPPARRGKHQPLIP